MPNLIIRYKKSIRPADIDVSPLIDLVAERLGCEPAGVLVLWRAYGAHDKNVGSFDIEVEALPDAAGKRMAAAAPLAKQLVLAARRLLKTTQERAKPTAWIKIYAGGAFC
jgi:hypothetical protein